MYTFHEVHRASNAAPTAARGCDEQALALRSQHEEAQSLGPRVICKSIQTPICKPSKTYE